MRKFIYVTAIFFTLAAFIFSTTRVLAVDVPDYCQQTPIPNDRLSQCSQILIDKSNELKAQANTLSSQIAIMDNQVKLTEAQIANTKVKIANLEKDIDITKDKVDNLQQNINNSTKALIGRIAATYQVGATNPWEIFLTSGSIENFFTRLKYLRIVQAYDKKTIYAAEQAKVDYENQKSIFEDKQAEAEALAKKLQGYTNQLAQEKRGKQVLLSQTQGSEANYQKLLSRARAQLSAFSNYTQSFGAELIAHQDLSDGWGKYFNQRDNQWGNLLVNNDSSNCRGGACTLARIGCLVTSYAMVSSHFGASISPADVAVNSGNFSVGSADFLLPGPLANGHSVSSVSDPSLQQLRDALNTGKVIIAGLSMNGGPAATHYSDHWVVLRSVEGDTFRINDPLYPGAMNVLLSDHYASWTIIQARIYN